MFEKSENKAEGFALLNLSSAGTELSLWSDEKKKDFCEVFFNRTRAAQYILYRTARKVADIAESRHFISKRAHQKLVEADQRISHDRDDYCKVGGRQTDELDAIVEERAKELTAELPGMFEAWSVLKPDTAKRIKRVEELQKALTKLGDEYAELDTEISLDDVDQNMTIAKFREYVNSVADKRNDLVRKMNKVAVEGNALRRQVDKELYSGNAELSKAVSNLVKQYFERAKYLGTMSRRVSEKIMFGDSQAAVELLKTFEDDEIKVSENVHKEFSGVLIALGISKKKRALKGKKK